MHHRTAKALVAGAAALGLVALGSCRGSTPHHTDRATGQPVKPAAEQGDKPDFCPPFVAAPPQIPGQRPEHLLASYWLRRADHPNSVLLTAEQITRQNARTAELEHNGWPVGRVDLVDLTIDRERVAELLKLNIDHLEQKIEAGKRFDRRGRKPSRVFVETLERAMREAEPADELRVVRRETPLRCYPTDVGLYGKATRDELAFDLVQCAQLRFGELVRVVARGRRFWYVWSDYARGWIDPGALGAAVPAAQARAYLEPQRFAVVRVDRVGVWSRADGGKLLGVARLGLRLPLVGRSDGEGPLQVQVPVKGDQPLSTGWIHRRRAVTVGYTPLTRAALLERAFRLVGSPYGWGGMGYQRDCSRLLMDLFGSFGLRLPRNSYQQSRAGVSEVDVSQLDAAAKREAIAEAARDGAVLLYMPGHIMLYVGSAGGQHYAIHLFSGYLKPCPSGGETMNRVNRTTVTSLELGRNSSRHGFLARLTKLVVFGPPPAGQQPPSSAEGGRNRRAGERSEASRRRR